jgi:uncharacterized membrane protein
MEYVLLLIVIILAIIILASLPNSDIKYLRKMVDAMGREIIALKNEIISLKGNISALPSKESTPPTQPNYSSFRPKPAQETYAQPLPPAPQPTPEPPAYIPPLIETPPPYSPPAEITPPPFVPLATPIPSETYEAPPEPLPVFNQYPLQRQQPVAAFTEPQPQYQAHQQTSPPYVPQKSSYEKWMSNNPDLEKFIGENLINKIGIAVLVLGIAFFVKYAIDQNWINETGRVAIGIGCGAILVGIAHYLRKGYRSFSSVLAGGGIAVFYFTIAFAYHQYHLMNQTTSFVIMVVITAFAVALSVQYDKLELAVIASIGGFITPFLVSNGEGNYIALFTYLTVLNVGLLLLAWFKRWPVLNVIALFFTELIYASWLSLTLTKNKPVSWPAALLFATIFYLIFMGMNMINQIRNRKLFKSFDFLILLFVSCSYYAGGMVVLNQWNNGIYQGLFTLGIGVINLILAYYVYKNGKADRNLLFLLIGLTFSFITLTIPIQLHGHAITMFWSAEFVLLYWLAGYSGIRLFKYSSGLLCVLSLVSLLMDWNNAANGATNGLLIIFSNTQGIVTNLVSIAAFGLYFVLLRRNKDDEYILGLPNSTARVMMMTVMVGLLYITSVFGVNLYYQHLTDYNIPNVYHRLITEAFGLALLVLLQTKILRANAFWQLPPVIVSFLFYIASTELIGNLRDEVIAGHYSWENMYMHWAGSILFIVLFIRTIQGIRRDQEVFSASNNALSIIFTIMIVAFLSLDLKLIYVAIGYHKGNTEDLVWQYGKAGLTALWGICSFALMWTGMKNKQKALRIISLTLFSIVLLKLFIFDISGISEGGKIFAFILLGVLLLTVSFMYQKLKKIIIDDRKE